MTKSPHAATRGSLHLSGYNYLLDDDGAVLKVATQFHDANGNYLNEPKYIHRPTAYAVGAIATLGSSEYVGASNTRKHGKKWFLVFDEDGISTNGNPYIKRTSGWCGTTDDVSVNAHGLVQITKIRELANGDISISYKHLWSD